MEIDPSRLARAFRTGLSALLAERNSEGYWIGELSTSALSTATAVSALALVSKHSSLRIDHSSPIQGGVSWLAAHQNPDGGWGDTVKSISNISTTMLALAAIHVAGAAGQYSGCLQNAERHLQEHFGKTTEEIAEAVRARYGKDRTFSVPILMTAALAGLVDWKEVPSLPFELACLPQPWFRYLKIPVVSYALPALIAIGQAVHYHRPPRNPFTRMIRALSRKRSLRVLESIQPSSGGFLEATPLTSFVTMGLASIGLADHFVARKAVEFLVKSARPDGSWPIDSNLATWVTTLAVNTLAAAGELNALDKKADVQDWLLRQQYKERHPYTAAEPGGWAWTDLPGGVPDGDDTPGALLALSHLMDYVTDENPEPASPRAFIRWNLEESPDEQEVIERLPPAKDIPWEARPHILSGLWWLLRLQNADGGWPTFCRGWGHLPFDRSGADLTAHALRALAAWKSQCDADQTYLPHLTAGIGTKTLPGFPLPDVSSEIEVGLAYLERTQRPDGSWIPLWFGNQYVRNDENPTYGTARVLAAYRDLDMMNSEPARRGIDWLLAAQNTDGGWGGAPGVASSIEESALAVEVLLDAKPQAVEEAVNKGLAWLVEQVEAGGLKNPTPIGFYFAKLWYFEKLYPIIFTVAAFGRACRMLSTRHDPAHPESAP